MVMNRLAGVETRDPGKLPNGLGWPIKAYLAYRIALAEGILASPRIFESV